MNGNPANSLNSFLSFLLSVVILCLVVLPITARQSLDSLQTILMQASNEEQRLPILQELAESSVNLKEYALAKRYARQAMVISKRKKDLINELTALKTLTRSYYYNRQRDSALLFIPDFIAMAEKLDDQAALGWATNFEGLIYRNLGQYQKSLEAFHNSISIKEKINDVSGLASSYNNAGLSFKQLGDYHQAQEYYQKSLAYRIEAGETLRTANLNTNIANLYKDMGQYSRALEYFFKALEVYEANDDKYGISATYNGIGIIHQMQHNYELALSYYNQALELAEQNDERSLLALIYGNLGNTYGSLEQYQQANAFLQKSLELEKELDNKEGIGRAYINLGIAQKEQKNYQEALTLIFESRKVYQELGAQLSVANTDIEIGLIYSDLGQYGKAIEYLHQGRDVALAQKNYYFLQAAYQGLAQAYDARQDFKAAYRNHQLYAAVTDTLLNAEKTRQMAQMQAQYDYEKNQAEILKLKSEKMAQDLAISLSDRARYRTMGISSAIILALLGLYFMLRYRQQKREADFEKKKVVKLQQIDELKDQFLANTSHELRTPLTGIIGIAESLQDGIAGPLPGRANENLQFIISSGTRLANLVNDILDFSKLKKHDLKLQLRPVDMGAVTDVVLTLSKPLLGSKNLQLINKVPKDTPLVSADENRIQQVLHNLIGNAIKFTDQGSITVSAKTRDNHLECSVADTGPGITADKFDAIFQSFEQLDGSGTRQQSGTGIGLAVTRQLIELHGGKIKVESRIGEGSVFSFTLPLSESQSYNSIEPKPEISVSTVLANGVPKGEDLLMPLASIDPFVDHSAQSDQIKILVVDDEPINRQVLENHLSLQGYQITHATNGKEALERVMHGEPFDLVLLDIMMPRMSGFEVSQKIRQKYLTNELLIIMLTAKNRVADLVQGFQAGANDYLTKPFSKDELISRIKTHLNLHRINKATGRFVPNDFLRAIGRHSITEARLGDHINKNVSILFSDIRDYTPLSETMSPEENFRFVNAYVGRMGPIIQAHGGFVNQYLGDAIMAVFPGSVDEALRAAIAMQIKIDQYNQERMAKGRRPIQAGMGLHTGPLIMGIIGDQSRMEAASISDTVNTGSRMEGLTKFFGARILISEASGDQLMDESLFSLRYLGQVQVKGKTKVTNVYECFDGDLPGNKALKAESLKTFNQGLQHLYGRNFPEAKQCFHKIIQLNPDDKVSFHFYEKATLYQRMGVPDNWTGIELMVNK